MHDELRRLTVPGDADSYKKFLPVIDNHPDIPPVNWPLINEVAPGLPVTPPALPNADSVVITWADAEWAAMEHVFCSAATPLSYDSRAKGTWPGWQMYNDDLMTVTGNQPWNYWGYYRLVTIKGKNVLLFKSNTHLDFPGEAYLEKMISLLIANVQPKLIMSIGTAGGARVTDHIGTVVAVNAGTLQTAHVPQNQWPEYDNAWQAGWGTINLANFERLLFPIPTTDADLAGICNQFNTFFGKNYTIAELNAGNLNMGDAVPALVNMTPAGISLLTTTGFGVANNTGNFAAFGCVEMDDAVIALTCKQQNITFGFVRNVSDPVQNAAIPNVTDQGNWGKAIYAAYGMYTSYNGALAAWAILNG